MFFETHYCKKSLLYIVKSIRRSSCDWLLCISWSSDLYFSTSTILSEHFCVFYIDFSFKMIFFYIYKFVRNVHMHLLIRIDILIIKYYITRGELKDIVLKAIHSVIHRCIVIRMQDLSIDIYNNFILCTNSKAVYVSFAFHQEFFFVR